MGLRVIAINTYGFFSFFLSSPPSQVLVGVYCGNNIVMLRCLDGLVVVVEEKKRDQAETRRDDIMYSTVIKTMRIM